MALRSHAPMHRRYTSCVFARVWCATRPRAAHARFKGNCNVSPQTAEKFKDKERATTSSSSEHSLSDDDAESSDGGGSASPMAQHHGDMHGNQGNQFSASESEDAPHDEDSRHACLVVDAHAYVRDTYIFTCSGRHAYIFACSGRHAHTLSMHHGRQAGLHLRTPRRRSRLE